VACARPDVRTTGVAVGALVAWMAGTSLSADLELRVDFLPYYNPMVQLVTPILQ
jgi:hypothetical protein